MLVNRGWTTMLVCLQCFKVRRCSGDAQWSLAWSSCRVRAAGKGLCPSPVPPPASWLPRRRKNAAISLQIRFFSLLTASLPHPQNVLFTLHHVSPARWPAVLRSVQDFHLSSYPLCINGFFGDDLYNRITRVFDFFPKGWGMKLLCTSGWYGNLFHHFIIVYYELLP